MATQVSKTRLFDRAFTVYLALLAIIPTIIGTLPGGFAWASSSLYAPRIFVLTVFSALSFMLWAISVYIEKTPIRLHKAMWLLLGLFILTVISTIFAESPIEAVFGGYDNPIGLLTYASLSVMLFLTVQFLASQSALTKLTKVITYSALIPAIIAWVSRIFLFDPFRSVSFAVEGDPVFMITRGMGTFGNPDFLGNYLVLPAVLALGLFAASRVKKKQILNGVTFVILAGAIIGTATRGAIIGFSLALLALVVLGSIKKYPVKLSVLLAVATIILSIAIAIPISAQSEDPIQTRLFGIQTETQQSQGKSDSPSTPAKLGGRAIFWTDIPEMIARSPIVGAGPANFTDQWRRVRSQATLAYGSNATMTDAHNLILQLLVTLGIPATLAALGLAIWAILIFFQASKKPTSAETSPPAGKMYYLAWGAGLFGMLISSIVAMSVIVWLLLIFVSLGALIAPQSKPFSAKHSMGSAIQTGTLIICSIFMLSASLWSSLWLASNMVYASAIRASVPIHVVEESATIAPFDLELRGTLAGFYRTQAEVVTPSEKKQYIALLDNSISHAAATIKLSKNYYPSYETYTVAHLMKWDLLQNQSDFDEAVSASKKGLELYPASMSMRTVMAQVYNERGEYQKSYDLLKEWWDANSDAAEAAKQFNIAKDGLGK